LPAKAGNLFMARTAEQNAQDDERTRLRRQMDIFSFGVNWWFTRSAHLGVNYRYITLDRFGSEGDGSGLNARILLMLD